ncbi:unnamed protein product (macronuclear) [Paramecium tetraurelia]|uniref:Transmembrane protein n=1 Tax=Paramecium tetraurelia TaxID=5888 RepID=A0D837_PARTE|nr:uncharacterized protein GSPATT00014171001 [Paramecium tetraurelia]CAK79204.1 unnamed protein product [Paramecium tetraurelia]|eukprot:XP_001446601.1 hypothetical protein (macronuclear) [Paramecium tetraurelia strain d4-2]
MVQIINIIIEYAFQMMMISLSINLVTSQIGVDHGEFKTEQSIEYELILIFGCMNNDAQYLITWDQGSKEIQSRKYCYLQMMLTQIKQAQRLLQLDKNNNQAQIPLKAKRLNDLALGYSSIIIKTPFCFSFSLCFLLILFLNKKMKIIYFEFIAEVNLYYQSKSVLQIIVQSEQDFINFSYQNCFTIINKKMEFHHQQRQVI